MNNSKLPSPGKSQRPADYKSATQPSATLRCAKHVLRLAFGLLLALAFTGCGTLGYYKQAAQGQWRIVSQRQPIEQLLADPRTPEPLRQQLDQVSQLRDFAERDLRLPVNGHYLKYAELGRPYVVWNVHAAPAFSLEPKTWWYPVVGRLKYRGYFAEADARTYAATLERQGYDVCVDGVEAYSTLGWFKDPVLNTFIHHPETELAEILFHELAHQRLFARGDTDFNEAFATAVAQEGVRRWLRARGETEALRRHAVHLQREAQFVELILRARRQLEALYREGATPDAAAGSGAGTPSQSAGTEQKQRIIARMRADYLRLKSDWGGYSGYDAWMARPLNNAQLNTVATYYHLVPAFLRLLEETGGDLEQFYRRADALVQLDKPTRHQRLAATPGP